MRAGCALVLLVVALAACTPAVTSTAAPTASATGPAPSPVAGLRPCERLDLRSPSGNLVDLTGLWTGGVTLHDVRQFDSCVWWVGRSNWPGDEVGSAWLVAFTGHLTPDFKLAGEYAQLYTAELEAPRRCAITFTIEFRETDGVEEAVLVNDDPDTDHPCAYYASTLFRLEGP